MSGIELKPIRDSGGTNILLPLGKTNLGRGSFLGVADKRVSRNHAVLEVDDGKIKIMPTHTNPTFVKRDGESKQTSLQKDAWHELGNGDQISLTPEEHIFQVVVDERPIVQETLSPRHSLGDGSPVKLQSPVKLGGPAQLKQSNGINDVQKANGQKDGDKAVEQTIEKDSKGDDDRDQAEAEEEEEKESVKDDDADRDKEEEEEEGEEKDDEEDNVQNKGEGRTVVDGDKELALPIQKERKLPAWMIKSQPQAAPAKQETPAKKDVKQSEEMETPGKRGRGRPKAGAKATPRSKPTPARAKGRSRAHDDDDDDYRDEDDASEEEPAPKRSRTSRSQRGSTKVQSYAEDDYDELDEEWVASEGDDDDGSDWEMDSQSYSSRKAKGRGRPARGKAVNTRKRGRRKKYTQSSDEDWSEEELYVPRPTKRRASSSSNSQSTREARGARRKPIKERDVSDDDEEEEEEVVPKKAKRTLAKTEVKEHGVSDEGEEEEEVKKPAKKKPDGKKKSCQFGKRCYRKNPEHFKEYCHPGDPDFKSLSDIEGSDDDDGRPECEYGTSCYRKHPEHKRQFKHTKSCDRSKLEAAKKRRKRESDDDDDGPNTYDYGDSFLNDEEEDSGSASPPDRASDDSDWGPEDSQDIRDLKKEAREFVRNKKMHKT